MALDATRLATALKNSLTSVFGTVTDQQRLQDCCTAIAQSIVTEITGHATVTVTSVSGVTPGGGVSGPGSGTVS